MRRVIGLIALGLGAFLLVAAPLMRFYMYPAVAKVPLDTLTQNVATGGGMSAFYLSERVTKDGLTLSSIRRVRGDVEASEAAGDNIAVWESHVRNVDDAGTLLTSTLQRAAFDRTTGAAVQCDCDTWASETEDPADRKPLEYKGQIFKFPFNTQKQNYDWWDANLEDTVDTRFVREETIAGTRAYVFEHAIPATPVRTQEIPGFIIDKPGMVTVDRVYENKRTIWVEPETGGVIKGREELNTRFQLEGADVLTLQKGTIEYDEDTVTRNAKDYRESASRLKLLRVTGPLVLAIVGLLLVIGGILLSRGTGPARPAYRSSGTGEDSDAIRRRDLKGGQDFDLLPRRG